MATRGNESLFFASTVNQRWIVPMIFRTDSEAPRWKKIHCRIQIHLEYRFTYSQLVGHMWQSAKNNIYRYVYIMYIYTCIYLIYIYSHEICDTQQMCFYFNPKKVGTSELRSPISIETRRRFSLQGKSMVVSSLLTADVDSHTDVKCLDGGYHLCNAVDFTWEQIPIECLNFNHLAKFLQGKGVRSCFSSKVVSWWTYMGMSQDVGG